MSSMSKRSTRKIGNVRVTRTESNGRVRSSQSTTFKGSNGFRATHRISKNSKGQDVHHYSTALGNGWVRRQTRSPSTGVPKSKKPSTSLRKRSSSKRYSNEAEGLIPFFASLFFLFIVPVISITNYITLGILKNKNHELTFGTAPALQKIIYILLYPIVLLFVLGTIILIISLIARVVE